MFPYLVHLHLAVVPGRLGAAVGYVASGSVVLLAERGQRRQMQDVLGRISLLRRSSVLLFCFFQI